MLGQRIITALTLLLLVLVAIFYLPTHLLALLLGAVMLIGASEWVVLAGLQTLAEKLGFYGVVTIAMLLAYQLLKNPDAAFWLFAAAAVWWFAVTLWILRYRSEGATVPGRYVKSMMGLFVLVTTWTALVALHSYGSNGPLLMLFTMSLTWVADIGAYFSGRRWGRVKLAPAISPGKTREGVYGALAGTAIWAGLFSWFMPEMAGMVELVIFCLLVCVVSVVGDLFESLLKRQAGVKDSGKLLPGHGGMLDRIDSLTAVAPVFVFGLMLIGGGK
ncbi:MAG: phosphatidate cytidylyltransferase [Sedimenticola sp.]